jgi:hypothetical protein
MGFARRDRGHDRALAVFGALRLDAEGRAHRGMRAVGGDDQARRERFFPPPGVGGARGKEVTQRRQWLTRASILSRAFPPGTATRCFSTPAWSSAARPRARGWPRHNPAPAARPRRRTGRVTPKWPRSEMWMRSMGVASGATFVPDAHAFEYLFRAPGQRQRAVVIARLGGGRERHRLDHADAQGAGAQGAGQAGADQAAADDQDVEITFI